MKITYTDSYNKSYKKLRKHKKEQQALEKIIDIIENTETFTDLCSNPLTLMYGFERLKHNLKEYYSFRLDKKGGVFRLILRPNKVNEVELYLIYISDNHYLDFDPERCDNYEKE